MNYKVIIFVIIILIIAIFLVLFNNKKKTVNPKELELTYDISAGIPFRWEVEVKDEDIVKFVRSYVIRNDNKGSIVGAKIYTNYVFKGLKEGRTTIIFKFYNFADDYVSGTREHEVIVDSDLNISLVDKE